MNLRAKTGLVSIVTIAIFSNLSQAAVHAVPVTVYVAPTPTGSDTRSYTQVQTQTTPAATIQKGIDLAHDGDTVSVAAGTYVEVINISKRNGLTITQTTSTRPIIKASGSIYHMVNIMGSTNIIFTGFEINGVNAGPNCDGVLMYPYTSSTPFVQTKHCEVSNCVVHDVGGGGIIAWRPNIAGASAYGCDYLAVFQNTIYNACLKSPYNPSAISLLGCVSDGNTIGANGVPNFHNFVNNNRIYKSINTNTDLDANGHIDPNKHTDGNGIIIDFQKDTGPWTLVMDNLVYQNGGRGIHVFNSSNVYVLNNTLYKNDQDPFLPNHSGELTVANGRNVLVSNNVVLGRGGTIPAFRLYGYLDSDHTTLNGTVHFKYNTYTSATSLPPSTETTAGNGSNGTGGTLTDAQVTAAAIDYGTTIYSDPAWGALFFNPEPANLGAADFRLNYLNPHGGLTGTAAQTARDRGSNVAGEFAAKDFNFALRYVGAGVDRGAYEQ